VITKRVLPEAGFCTDQLHKHKIKLILCGFYAANMLNRYWKTFLS